jgi:hypothetical protein
MHVSLFLVSKFDVSCLEACTKKTHGKPPALGIRLSQYSWLSGETFPVSNPALMTQQTNTLTLF